jgi:hypothetical protein
MPLEGVSYKHNYGHIVADISAKKVDELSVYRALILNDLWFLLYFAMGYGIAHHPFWVKCCREVEDGPLNFTLDIWAREHGKSSIITKGETIQHILKYPEKSCGIFSYIKPLAKKFLFEIKETFATNRFLKACFPDVIWDNCEKESPLWALDEGIVLKRRTNMAEPTVSAWGLTEGMPIGMHFDRRVYDDISTQDMAKSMDVMESVKMNFDSSQNIGKEGGHHRVIGTYYHHDDPLIYIRDKKTPEGVRKYMLRLKPATHDATATGRPIYLSQTRLDDLKGDQTFNFQQLLDPTPMADRRLNPEFMGRVERKAIPGDLYRVMLIDQAGDLDSNKGGGGDSWAVGVIGVEKRTDNIGQCNIYIEDLWITPSSESEAIEQIVRMYLAGGMIQRLGVEKVGQTTTHLHIASALKARGRYVDFDEKTSVGVLLRPAGRTKRKLIESALSWPLNNGKIHYSSDIPNAYVERLRLEMSNFPYWHDDGINMLAYLYDVIKDCSFAPGEGYGEEDAYLEKHAYKPVSSVVGY